MTCDEAKPLLNARMDGEIDPVQRTALDSHVETCSSCTADLELLENVRDAIRGDMPYHKAPADLRSEVRAALRGAEYLDSTARGTGWRVWGAVAATVAFCALAAAPFIVSARNQRQLIAEEFLSAHQRALIGRSVDVISSDQHTVKPWFNGKLPFSPPVTDLASDGFPLEGGRVDYAGERPVAALVYGRRLHKIDVFVRPSYGENAPPAHFERNGYNEISWKKNTFLFTAVSDLNDAELAAFVNLLQIRQIQIR
jgi:anti-sigma factor (TIGR02949 family)